MNAKQFIAAIAVFAAAGSAFAIEAAPTTAQDRPVATKIRTVIRAEAIPARTDGPLASGAIETFQPAAIAIKSRLALHTTARPFEAGYDLRT